MHQHVWFEASGVERVVKGGCWCRRKRKLIMSATLNVLCALQNTSNSAVMQYLCVLSDSKSRGFLVESFKARA